MLFKISIALFALSVILVILYVIIVKKSPKADKTGIRTKTLRRVMGAFSMVTMITAAVLLVLYLRSNNIKLFDEKVNEYDPVKIYTKELKAKGADKAYAGLPDDIFTFGDKIYFKNGKGDLFEILSKKTTAEDGTAVTEYYTKTVKNGVNYVGGKNTLKAMITKKGELVLDGYLLYTEFDGSKREYKNEIVAENVKYCTLTDNSLFYITNAGDMYAIGFNEYGQLGDTTTKNKASATFIEHDIEKCAISETHSMTIDKFGTLRAVGDNSYSQLGNKTAIPTTEPITIMQGAKDVKIGNFFSIVLAINGEVLTAGNNEKGQLGNSGEIFKAELVSILTAVDKIDVHGDTCAALTHEGVLYVWGDNKNAKAGLTGSEIIVKPTKVYENVEDFTLGKNGVSIITKDKNIFTSTAEGKFVEVLNFGAQIPDNYKAETELIEQPTPDAA